MLIIIFITSSVKPMRLLQEISETSRNQDSTLRSLINLLSTHSNGRRLNAESIAKAKEMYKSITKNMSKKQIKKWLRQEVGAVENKATDPEDIVANEDQVALVERELTSALYDKKSALYDRPYLEKMGENDFLVINDDLTDQYVTVIPNAIYYNIEKKCVNWLDDCSLKGIRARLLRGAHSP